MGREQSSLPTGERRSKLSGPPQRGETGERRDDERLQRLQPLPTRGAQLCNRGRARLSRPPPLGGETGEPQSRRVQQSAWYRQPPVEEEADGLRRLEGVWGSEAPPVEGAKRPIAPIQQRPEGPAGLLDSFHAYVLGNGCLQPLPRSGPCRARRERTGPTQRQRPWRLLCLRGRPVGPEATWGSVGLQAHGALICIRSWGPELAQGPRSWAWKGPGHGGTD